MIFCSCSQVTNDMYLSSDACSADLQFPEIQSNDIHEILSQDNEIISTASIYNVTYGLENFRKMYVFSAPVREYANNGIVNITRTIQVGEQAPYEVINNAYGIRFFADAVQLTNFDQSIYIHLENLTEEAKKGSYIGLYDYPSDCITYKKDQIELQCIPTYYGLTIELNFLEKPESDYIEFKMKLQNCDYDNDAAGYVKFYAGDTDTAVLYPGISTDNSGETFINDGLILYRRNGETYLKFDVKNLMKHAGSYPVKSSINLDLYNEKMFFDSSVYQDKPQLNSLLNNISVFDNKNADSVGYTYLKLNLDSITPANSSLLDTLYYYFFVMACSEGVDLEAYLVSKNWCSFTINWDSKPEYKQKIGEVHIDQTGYHRLDITDFACEYIENAADYSAECSLLLKLKDTDQGMLVLASADNTWAPPYFEVNYTIGD